MNQLVFIMFLVLILIIIGIIIISIYLKIRNKIRSLSQQIYGVDDIIKGIKKQEELYENTPKSISAMTRIYLPHISKDFPYFNWDDYKSKTESLIMAYLNSLETKSGIDLDYVSLSLKNKVDEEIVQMNNDGISVDFKSIKIHRTEITDYTKRNGLCTIKTETAVGYTRVLNGDLASEKKEQVTYKTELSYIQNEEALLKTGESFAGNNCMNCGAAVSNLGAKSCEYCGSALIDININTWKFISILKGK